MMAKDGVCFMVYVVSYLFIPFSPFKKKLYKEKWVVIDIPDTCIQNMYEVHSIKNANLSIKYE